MPYFSFTQFNIGPINFYTWGLFLGLAFLAGCWLFLKRARKEGIEEKKILWLFFWVFVGIIFGSRFLYLLQFPIFDFSAFFQFRAGGFTFYGGLLGGLLAGWLYARKNKLSFWQLADWAAPAIALGIFIGRIGCSLINDHQGTLTNLPWAIQWPDGSLRHPVAEYLALNGLIMFFVLRRMHFFVKRKGGLFIIFLAWYSISRFLLDFTRTADTTLGDPRYFNLMISQWMSLFVLITLGGFFVLARKKIIR